MCSNWMYNGKEEMSLYFQLKQLETFHGKFKMMVSLEILAL